MILCMSARKLTHSTQYLHQIEIQIGISAKIVYNLEKFQGIGEVLGFF